MKASIALLLLLTSTTLVAQQDESVTIMSGGIERRFVLHVPSASPQAGLPVVLAYHGSGGTAESMLSTTGFNALADQHGFIVAYPHSLDIGGLRQWNVYVDAEPGHAGVGAPDAPDDVLFTRDIIGYLSDRFAIDMARVYATGLSNGGFMSYALSLLASNDIAAIAPVAASLWGDSGYITQLSGSSGVRMLPVMHVHGTADNVVDYPDPDMQPRAYEEYPLFIPARACGANTYADVATIAPTVHRLVFCREPVDVSLVRVTGMGHTWSNGAFSTSREIVSFFGLDAGSAGAVDRSTTPHAGSVRVVDAAIVATVDKSASVEVISSTGIFAYSSLHERGTSTTIAAELPSGVYLVRIAPQDGSASVTQPVVIVR